MWDNLLPRNSFLADLILKIDACVNPTQSFSGRTLVEILKCIEVTVTLCIPYKGPYVVKSQLVEQNDPFLIHEIACIQVLPLH